MNFERKTSQYQFLLILNETQVEQKLEKSARGFQNEMM